MNYRKMVLFSSILLMALLTSFLPFSRAGVDAHFGGGPPAGYTAAVNDIDNDIEWDDEPAPGLGESARLVSDDELLIAYEGDWLYIYESNGDRRDLAAAHFDAGDRLAAGDVDGDGVDEMLIAIDDEGSIHIYELDGSQRRLTVSFGQYDSFAAGDVDGDGVDEMVIASTAGTIYMYESDGSERHMDAEFYSSSGLAVADVDGDRVDEVLIGTYRDPVSIYEPDGSSRRDAAGTSFYPECGFAAGDVDDDGVDEILFACQANVFIYESDGARREFAARFNLNDGFAAGDIDADGVDEILIAKDEDSKVYVYESNGYRREFGANLAGAAGFAVGDVDGDSLIVGEPRHTVQTITDQVIAVINAPPEQRGVNYAPGKFTATYKSAVEGEVVESVTAKTGWALTTEVKIELGIDKINKVEAEYKSKIEQEFERESGTTYTLEIARSFVADGVDVCIALDSTYDVYEYKILSPPELAMVEGKQQYFVVTIPKKKPESTSHTWDSHSHTLGDIRTYPSDVSQLVRYDDDHLICSWTDQIGLYEVDAQVVVTEEMIDKEKDSSLEEVSLKIGVNVGLGLLETNVSLQGDYHDETIVTHETKFTEQTAIKVHADPGLTADQYYTVKPVMYYDNEFGYLVLDHVVVDMGSYYESLPAPFEIMPIRPIELPFPLIGGTLLVVEDGTMSPGGTIQIPINIENAEDIGNMDVTLTYDPEVLSATEVTKGSLTKGSLFESNIADGVVRIGLVDNGGISGNASIARIGFEVVGSPGDSCTLAATVSANKLPPRREEVNVAVRSGLFTVQTVEELKGDCDGDGDVDSVDALLALKMSVGEIEVNLIADMNDDGRVTSLDAAEILGVGVKDSVIEVNLAIQGIDKRIKPRTKG